MINHEYNKKKYNFIDEYDNILSKEKTKSVVIKMSKSNMITESRFFGQEKISSATLFTSFKEVTFYPWF